MINKSDIEAMKPTRWIKIPRSKDYRGEGEWEEFDEYCKRIHLTSDAAEDHWQKLVLTNYLPIKESHERPE